MFDDFDDFDDAVYCQEYAEYIIDHGEIPCFNAHMLLALMEEKYLFEEYLKSNEI